MTRLKQFGVALAMILAGLVPAAQAHDAYEHDDEPSRASPFQVGSNQVHTFHSSTDEDWVRFLVPPGGVVDIEVEQLGGNIDVRLEVYYEDFNGAMSNVAYLAVDDLGKGIGEEEFTAVDLVQDTELPFGFYLLRVFSADTNCFGVGAAYKVQIFEPVGATLLAVIALDSHGSGKAPSNAVAVINGVDHYPFGAGNTITVPDLPPGVHSVEVRTPPGFVSVADPDAPAQKSNPNNPLFGNPRSVRIQDGVTPFLPFVFDPVVRVQGRVVDAYTGAGIAGVPLAFEGATGPVSGIVYTQRFNGAWYDSPWKTEANGDFPENVILEKAQYSVRLNPENYIAHLGTNAVVALVPGTTNHQGDISLTPLDGNTNGIADVWEQQHFGGTTGPQTDGDGDGAGNRAEYLAGTDPTNRHSVLGFEPLAIPGTNAICMAWPVVQGRVYSIETAPSAAHTNRIVLLDRWVAPSNGVHRYYDHASRVLSSRVYRVRLNLP